MEEVKERNKEGNEERRKEGKERKERKKGEKGDGQLWLGRRSKVMAGGGRRWAVKAQAKNGRVQLLFNLDFWSFGNEASENEAIAPWKEHSEGRKMVWLLVAKVV